MVNDIDMLFVHPSANTGNSKATLDADVGYTDQFISFPTGFFSMANNLRNSGFNAKILNLGERLYFSKDNNLELLVKEFVRDNKSKIIGIDIHWMIHSAGAMKTAEFIKKYSPDTKIVLGGYTASHFAKEILQKYPFIDFVMKGQCDESIVDLVKELSGGNPNLSQVPSLIYRSNKDILENMPTTPNVRKNLELTCYDFLIDKPKINQDRAIITMYRGCDKACNYCTGNIKSFKDVMGANETYIIDAETVVKQIKKNKEKGKDKIYLYGDIRRGGEEYVKRFFDALGKSKISDAHIVFEFFELADRTYLEMWDDWAKRNNSTLEATHSPESGNQQLRRQYHKGYTNEELTEHCKLVTEFGIPQSTYFMLGIPGQTSETIQETLKLADKLVGIYTEKFRKDDLRHDVLPYNFMQIPDGGSMLFQNPEKYGFEFDFNGFEGLVNKLEKAKHWTDAVGFRTNHFSKKGLIEKYYEIQRSMRTIYHKHGLFSDKEYLSELNKLERDRDFYKEIKNVEKNL